MWPWEHLAVGYLALSVWRRLRGRGPPSDRQAVAVAVGTQFPDLVDKPLAWGTSILPAGRSMAHSLVVAVPVVVAVYLLARWVRAADVGSAFAVGYLSHLPGDVVYPLAYGDSLAWHFLAWPFVALPPSGRHSSLFGTVVEFLAEFATFLSTPRGVVYLSLELALLLGALLVWWWDGWPGLASVRAALVRVAPA